MTYREFLEGPIKEQTQKIGLDYNLAWHAFALDAISIEFLGKIAKSNNSSELLGKKENSKDLFIHAIENYFPPKYKPFAEFLYTNLRCGMAHSFAPKPIIILGTKSPSPRNLEIQENGNFLLVFEEFHNDLCSAIDKLIFENKPLLNEAFLNTK
jgi:hypothetical protein